MIRLHGVKFGFDESSFRLCLPDLEFKAGECVAIVGPSGSGKSSLLKLIAGIYTPHAGSIHLGDFTVSDRSESQRRIFRLKNIGQIFQDAEMLPHLNALENVLLPYYVNTELPSPNKIADKAKEKIAEVGLAGFERRRVDHLSGGERQRLAICRAVLTEPKFLLADEPTANLDRHHRDTIIDLLVTQARNLRATLILVTHDSGVLQRLDRTIDLAEVNHS